MRCFFHPKTGIRGAGFKTTTAVIGQQFISRLRAIAAGVVVRKISLLCCPSVEHRCMMHHSQPPFSTSVHGRTNRRHQAAE